MKKVLVSYADGSLYKQLQQQSIQTATNINCFNDIYTLGRECINEKFYSNNRSILDSKRGAGYWLWKPYIVDRMLKLLEYGDILMYADTAIRFTANLEPIFNIVQTSEHGMWYSSFTDHTHTTWTKKKTFELLDCTDEIFITGEKKFMSSAQVFAVKKNDFAIKFIQEWLHYCCIEDCITDKILGDNYPDFKDHRHDQSILSLLLCRHDIKTYHIATQYGNSTRPSNYLYDQLMHDVH